MKSRCADDRAGSAQPPIKSYAWLTPRMSSPPGGCIVPRTTQNSGGARTCAQSIIRAEVVASVDETIVRVATRYVEHLLPAQRAVQRQFRDRGNGMLAAGRITVHWAGRYRTCRSQGRGRGRSGGHVASGSEGKQPQALPHTPEWITSAAPINQERTPFTVKNREAPHGQCGDFVLAAAAVTWGKPC